MYIFNYFPAYNGKGRESCNCSCFFKFMLIVYII